MGEQLQPAALRKMIEHAASDYNINTDIQIDSDKMAMLCRDTCNELSAAPQSGHRR